jgi:hypothetical protein
MNFSTVPPAALEFRAHPPESAECYPTNDRIQAARLPADA